VMTPLSNYRMERSISGTLRLKCFLLKSTSKNLELIPRQITSITVVSIINLNIMRFIANCFIEFCRNISIYITLLLPRSYYLSDDLTFLCLV
jgi:hypothetical protein